jgi:hypothetical protein
MPTLVDHQEPDKSPVEPNHRLEILGKALGATVTPRRGLEAWMTLFRYSLGHAISLTNYGFSTNLGLDHAQC